MAKFVFLDVETPNRNNDRMSSLGIIVVENGIVCHEACHLINPEVRFDPFNIQLTGITPYMVSEAPNFEALWPLICAYFDKSIIVAHNATFDLSVLTMTMAHYGIEIPKFKYICTLNLSKQFLNYRKNSLDFVCATLGILLEKHHEALSDARGCQGIFYYIVEHFGYNDALIKEFYRPNLRGKSASSGLKLKSTTEFFAIRNNVFCLTGDFKFGDKTDVELYIIAHGGQVANQVTKKVDCLIVGALGSTLWAYGHYGKKVKKAFELRDEGGGIDIVLERDFFSEEKN